MILAKCKFIVLALALCDLYSFAQTEDPLSYIRSVYADSKAFCENHDNTTQIKYKRIVPGVGDVYTTVDFCGDEALGEEAASHPWGNDGVKKLNFVFVRYNIAAPTVELEYLYDPKTQQVLFYYEKDWYNEKEHRYYFKESQLIKVVSNPLSDENSEDNPMPKYEATSNFPEELSKRANKIVNKSEVYREQFEQLYSLEKIEKR